MKTSWIRIVLLTVGFALALCAPAWADQVVWDQPFDQTGNAYASQNDTNGSGLFAQMYDNFTPSENFQITQIKWTGAYFNPPQQGQITGWTISLYADAGGQPGSLLNTFHRSGNLNETFLGDFGGFPFYEYFEPEPDPWDVLAGTQYWFSVIPDLGFPPQWGWGSGIGGDGISYQDFFGTRSQIAADMAFTIYGSNNNGVPEPGTLIMLATGVLGVAGAIRRKLPPTSAQTRYSTTLRRRT